MSQAEQSAVVEACIDAYRAEKHNISVFGDSVRNFFATHPALTIGDMPAIHSVRYRLKNEDHLRAKILRKDREITSSTLFREVTDLAGVRVLHLHRAQFGTIHKEILKYCDQGHWALFEEPTAYTWDPEYREAFERLGLKPQLKESHYTSIHYVVKPNESVAICCEIQVRTLFEEVWGEIDHLLNYPRPTPSIACQEQLRVMAKMVGASSRLAEAIFRSHLEFSEQRGTSETATPVTTK